MIGSVFVRFRSLAVGLLLIVIFLTAPRLVAPAAAVSSDWYGLPFCVQYPGLCTDVVYPTYKGRYIGHDEPAVLFYSNTPGAGNRNIYLLTLPKDPPTLPKQNGLGGIFNFQLHPAFWFGMAMCDTQSFPETVDTCTAESDANIFDNPDNSKPDFIGNHPGTAFMEMQFYPPGWVKWGNGGSSCDGRHWCAALNIDSLSQDADTGLQNNADCLNKVGVEPVNFAFITKSGNADSPADPLNNSRIVPNLKTEFLMKPGDRLAVDLHDTPDGFQVVIYDLTTHKSGSMTASIANGFKQVEFDPNAATCSSTPYAFHSMYSTSTPHTRVPWSAHSYNIAFADEIGHWEYCANADPFTGLCLSGGDSDNDDQICFNASASTRVKVGGCLQTDFDFDGVCYQDVWPGTNSPATDKKLHPQPILFTSPLIAPTAGGALQNFSTTAAEADLPIIEGSCDVTSGSGCTNPPSGANFYPFFSSLTVSNVCEWALGGSMLTGASFPFGSNSTDAFGPLFPLVYPEPSETTITIFDNFQKALGNNPCNAPAANLMVPAAVNFGTHKKGSSSPVKKLSIVNQSPYPIAIANVSLTPPNPDYTLTNGCGALLKPLGTCFLSAKFKPSITGPDNGIVQMVDDASNTPQSITLNGAGK